MFEKNEKLRLKLVRKLAQVKSRRMRKEKKELKGMRPKLIKHKKELMKLKLILLNGDLFNSIETIKLKILKQYRDEQLKAAKDIREGHLTDHQKHVIIGASLLLVFLLLMELINLLIAVQPIKC